MIRFVAPFALLGLAACVMPAPETEVPEGNWLLPGTTWKLVELGGAPYTASTTATLTEDGRVTGQAPCNAFNANYVGRWPDLSFETVATTRAICPQIEEERLFLSVMDQVNHAELLTDSLLLTGPDGASLRFVRS
ncbi:META domain-containing protein [Amaricoccus sp.]|uniref:META domain-containing protein n=1 Tax=Amaricoccus sp. TaxID=1872485 RepID=UPI00262B6C4B|nr:META domain-containing protein [uncultured Amaricoccus sp.]